MKNTKKYKPFMGTYSLFDKGSSKGKGGRLSNGCAVFELKGKHVRVTKVVFAL